MSYIDANKCVKRFMGQCQLFVVVFLLFFPALSYSSEQHINVVKFSDESIIVYAANDSTNVIIHSGAITTTAGQSVRLLPGTRIEAGSQLKVDISNKTYQDAIAEIVAKEKEKEMLACVTKMREVLFSVKKATMPISLNEGKFPGQNSQVGQFYLHSSALLVNSTVSLAAQVSYLIRKNTLNDIHNLQVLAFQYFYTPVSSWGECCETIKVMRS